MGKITVNTEYSLSSVNFPLQSLFNLKGHSVLLTFSHRFIYYDSSQHIRCALFQFDLQIKWWLHLNKRGAS